MTPRLKDPQGPEEGGREALLSAAIRGDAAKLEALLDQGLSPDTYDAYGEPAAQLAARHERPEALEALIRRGANMQDIGPLGNTLLHCMALYPRVLHLLPEVLRRGAEIDARTDYGQTPLGTAARSGCVEWMQALLAAGADPSLKSQDGTNLLHHLVDGNGFLHADVDQRPHLEMVRRLLALGLDPTEVGAFGESALTSAARHGLVQVLDLFARFKVSPNTQDGSGFSPLQAAAFQGRTGAAEALLAQGADLDLHSAASLGHLDRVRRILEADPSLLDAVHVAQWQRSTPLARAIQHGHADLALFLLERGADANGANPENSHLHGAMRHCPDPRLVRELIQRGANLEAGDGDGNTPLNYAARHDRLEAARLLLGAGADPNSETERGYTPAMFAVSGTMRALLNRHGGRE